MLAKDLVKVFNGNKRWRATDMNISEAATVAIALASLKMQTAGGPGGPVDRFSADIGDIIRANLKEASGTDLINLAKSTHYMRQVSEPNKDLYSHVHAECISRRNLRTLDPEDAETLAKVFSAHGVFTDSPFTSGNVRVNR